MRLWMSEVASPIGTILMLDDAREVVALDFEDCEPRMRRLLEARYGALQLEQRTNPTVDVERLEAYLGGQLDALQDIRVNVGGTQFQRNVWSALRRVPIGTTVSYGSLARKLGRPTAARAVGLANSLNPVALVVPCHRVVGADGSLTGYAGGIERKRWLLQHEGLSLFD